MAFPDLEIDYLSRKLISINFKYPYLRRGSYICAFHGPQKWNPHEILVKIAVAKKNSSLQCFRVPLSIEELYFCMILHDFCEDFNRYGYQNDQLWVFWNAQSFTFWGLVSYLGNGLKISNFRIFEIEFIVCLSIVLRSRPLSSSFPSDSPCVDISLICVIDLFIAFVWRHEWSENAGNAGQIEREQGPEPKWNSNVHTNTLRQE